jgi:hypothetical protein
MSAFPESGRSISMKNIHLTGRKRPKADIDRRFYQATRREAGNPARILLAACV